MLQVLAAVALETAHLAQLPQKSLQPKVRESHLLESR